MNSLHASATSTIGGQEKYPKRYGCIAPLAVIPTVISGPIPPLHEDRGLLWKDRSRARGVTT
jgi:hypothetical protein